MPNEDVNLIVGAILIVFFVLCVIFSRTLHEHFEKRNYQLAKRNERIFQLLGFEEYEMPANKGLSLAEILPERITFYLMPGTLLSVLFLDRGVTRKNKTYIGIGGTFLGFVVLAAFSQMTPNAEESLALTWLARFFLLFPIVQLLRWKHLTWFVRITGIIYSFVVLAIVILIYKDTGSFFELT